MNDDDKPQNISIERLNATHFCSFRKLPLLRVVQKAFIDSDSTYIYALQYHKRSSNCVLSKCKISNGLAIHESHMLLKNFGHTETLEMYRYDGSEYFWIGCNANHAKAHRFPWSVDVGRIEYVPNTTIESDSVFRLAGLVNADETGSSFGRIRRVESALTTDNKRVLFWIQNTSGQIRYSMYDFMQINDALSGISGEKPYIECNVEEIKKAWLYTREEKGKRRFRPNNSLQGIEISDGTTYTDHLIYVSGGAKGDIPMIGRMNLDGESRIFRTPDHPRIRKHEIEGIQLKGDDLYFVVNTFHDDIYRVKISDF